MKRVRCAIYTRKSSEEGLEQDFNSLDAQREACAAYVLSQACEGWTLNPDIYDDGGVSGGTLERPGLKRLLGDIADGKVDIVVVYKVDRLTRSLLDFSKLVEAFDAAGTSFVSITQSFNTTTSMGRLTLNMLLSFAQFEREVTAERIRDKIAASKAKGMWMGGTPPLGYRPEGRSLAIVPDHAELIRNLFRRYLDTGNVRHLAQQLAEEAVHAPARTSLTGRAMGGGAFTRGQIYKILSNPIYLGEIHHKGRAYDGQHQAIVDRALWDQVQARLAGNRQGHQRGTRAKSPSLLAGLVKDETGEPLVAAHAAKNKVRYRYYVSRALQHEAAARQASNNEPRVRVPARDLEQAVIMRLTQALSDPLDLALQLGVSFDGLRMGALGHAATTLAERVQARERDTLRSLVAGVAVLPGTVRLDLHAAALAQALGLPEPADQQALVLTSAVRLSRTGMAMRMVLADGRPVGTPVVNATLVQLLVKARAWWHELAKGEIDRAGLAHKAGVIPSYVSRVVRLAFLSPKLVDAILTGNHPASLDGGRLLAPGFPASWKEQERLFLGEAAG